MTADECGQKLVAQVVDYLRFAKLDGTRSDYCLGRENRITPGRLVTPGNHLAPPKGSIYQGVAVAHVVERRGFGQDLRKILKAHPFGQATGNFVAAIKNGLSRVDAHIPIVKIRYILHCSPVTVRGKQSVNFLSIAGAIVLAGDDFEAIPLKIECV